MIEKCWSDDDYDCDYCVNDYIHSDGSCRCFILTLRRCLLEGKPSEIPSYKADHCSYYDCDNCLNNINNKCVLDEIYMKEFKC